MRLPRKAFWRLFLATSLGLLTWLGVHAALQPKEQQVYVPFEPYFWRLGTFYSYNLDWRYGLWQDMTGRYLGIPHEFGKDSEIQALYLCDFENPRQIKNIKLPDQKMTLQSSSSEPALLELEDPPISLHRGRSPPVRDHQLFWINNWSDWIVRTDWKTCVPEVELSVSVETRETWKWWQWLAAKLNLGQWLSVAPRIVEAKLIDSASGAIYWSHLSDHRRYFQAVAGIRLSDPYQPDYTLSLDQRSILLERVIPESITFSRWPIILWSPWWARGAGMLAGFLAGILLFVKFRP
jgi:hypothetical protein